MADAIKAAIYKKLVENTDLTTKLGGPNVFYRNGGQPSTLPCVTFYRDSRVKQNDVPLMTSTFNVSIWSTDPDFNDDVGDMIEALFDHGTLAPTSGRVANMLVTDPQVEFFDQNDETHQKVVVIIVMHYPA